MGMLDGDGVEVRHLLWSFLTSHLSEFHICTSATFVFLCLVYGSSSLPFLVMDYFDMFPQYKIQKNRKFDANEMRKALRVLVFNHVFLVFPLIFVSYPILVFRNVRFDTLSYPSWTEVCVRLLVYLVVEDLWVYVGHRILHWPRFYVKIHKLHHDFEQPFGMVSSYAHPIEFIFLGTGTFLGPLLLGGDHFTTIWLWALVRQVEAIDVHCGYDFPWSLSHWLPFYCGPEFHDFHHFSRAGNFATTFTWCDSWFRSDTDYRRFKRKGGHHGLSARTAIPRTRTTVPEIRRDAISPREGRH
eukprot:ANDGO_01007.mRNA.1 Methylsterol monooxygenase 2-2